MKELNERSLLPFRYFVVFSSVSFAFMDVYGLGVT